MATATSYPTGYVSTYRAKSVSNLENAYNGSDNTTYAQISLYNGRNAYTQIYYTFGFNIPTNATIDSVSCSCKAMITNTNSSVITTRQVQLCSDSTLMGTAYTLEKSTDVFNISAGAWTASQLNNARIRLYAVRGSSNTSTTYYIRFYGATFTVTYTEPSGNKIMIKSSGTWKQAQKVYVKVSGTWKEVSKVFKKVNGSWVEQSDKSAMFDPNALYQKGT